MSDVAPSFFPTPHEIAGGIRWVRDHPVVATAAAAAATAVSVITFLRARTLIDDEDDQLEIPTSPTDTCARDLDELPPPRERFSTWTEHYPRLAQPELRAENESAATLLSSHKRSQSNQDFTPHKLRKEAEDIYSNTDSEISSISRSLSRRNSPASSSRLCDDMDSSEESPRGVNIPPTCVEGVCFEPVEDPNSYSPQWGWYVSTTPPDEQYS